ncbi:MULTISPECIES: hypothetical protein [Bradyrhizobium]|uniref:hypothetical protein n=1 Tax=Bradyrhizobium TaxID=374 RepID=UPI001319C948|nr:MULTISPECIES: hypothetical protein [Bradyrhizobium]UWU93581.1 hypothetical protein N2604_06530 [Bradyrhizobium sp. CB1015]
MLGRWPDLLSLSIAALVCRLLFLFPQTVFEKTGLVRISLLDWISLEHDVHKGLIRLLALLLVVACGAASAFRDYSHSFPDLLNVNVFFYGDGIEKTIQSMSDDDITKLNSTSDWKQRKKEYYTKINNELQELGIPFKFGDAPGQTSATGPLRFRTQPIEKWGAQLYRITEAGGTLVHVSQSPGTEEYRTVSEFGLTNSDFNLKGTVKDVYWENAILIMPVLKQLYRISPSREIYHHSLIAATRVEIFPYINISKTVYLVPSSDRSPMAFIPCRKRQRYSNGSVLC